MKKINYLFFCLLLSAAFVVGCKSDDGGDDPGPDEQTEEEKALAELQGTWEVTDVTRDNGDPVGDYSNMELTISKQILSTSGGPNDSVFPVGSFTFVEGSDYRKIDVEGEIIDLTVSDKTLIAVFTIDNEESSGGKVLGVDGKYTFTFSKAAE